MTAEQNCPDASRFEELLACNVSDEEQEELGRHIEQCDACRRRLEELAGDVSVVTDIVGDTRQNADDTPQLEGVIDKLLAEGPDQTITSVCDESNERDSSLDFLDPTDHPDHLGRLGSYEIAGVIGRGGMGVVLRGMDARLDRPVAIKVLHRHLLCDGVARKRFFREAKAAAAVTHDHVVTIHAVDEAKGIPFLVMEYVAGVSLDERIKRDGTLTLEEILRIGMQTASGLSAAHAQGLVHRDIKPSNILLENGVERVKITDFGLARIVHDAQITQSNVVAGTPEYMSPEQAQGDPLDHRSDLFSLGCLLYAMCTGRSPFRGSSTIHAIRRVCDDTPRSIQEINREIPDWLVDIINRLLAKKADDRFQSASEVAELLENHLAHLQRPSEVPLPPRARAVAQPVTRPAGDVGQRWHYGPLRFRSLP
jgi:serine/threonine protein kinase